VTASAKGLVKKALARKPKMKSAGKKEGDMESMADGMSFGGILDAYLQLTKESVQAALACAADIVRREIFPT
jgi:hypothetical protein